MKTAEEILKEHGNWDKEGLNEWHYKCIIRAMEEYASQRDTEPKEEGKGAEEILNNAREGKVKYQIDSVPLWTKSQAIEAMHEYASLPAKVSVDVNFLLVNALRHLDNEQIKALADSLYERIPKEQSITDELGKCDVCGNHPSVLIRTQFGQYCQLHAKYI